MPAMISVIFGFVSFCFLYGLVLVGKQIFIRERRVSALSALHLSWGWVFVAVFLFLFIPCSVQNVMALLLKKIPVSIDKVLWMALVGETSLALYILLLLKSDPRIIPGIGQKIVGLSHLLRDILEGYCQCLPLLFGITLFWKFIVDVLHQWGLPVSFDQQPIIQLLAHSKPQLSGVFAIGVCVVLLAPLCEEIFFRGVLLRFLHSRISLKKSLWTCSLIFALVHQHFASFLPLCFLGYWLGLSYIKTRCIWTNVGIHALFNGTNLVLVLAVPEL